MIEHWTEMRTALFVARFGTVSAAAEAIGLHRATVLRHIEILEKELGEKLFFRHDQGYTPTEAGHELMLAADSAEERFSILKARIRARLQIQTGDIVLTSMPVVAPRLMSAVLAFHLAHPGVTIRHIATSRSLKLERGEAHVAVRATPTAGEPDNVEQPFAKFNLGLFASRDYLDRMGEPKAVSDLAKQEYVAPETSDLCGTSEVYSAWLGQYASESQVVFRTTDLAVLDSAVEAGIGMGFVPVFAAKNKPNLVQVLPEHVSRIGELKIVTHVDFHRTPRIQALIKVLKAGWTEKD